MPDAGPTFHVHDSSLCVGGVKTNPPANKRERAWGRGFESPDYETFNRLQAVMAGRGFRFTSDPEVDARHPSLSKRYRLGQADTPHGALKVRIEMFPAGGRLDFFQDVVISNPNGGRYDFDKVGRMPYLIRKKYEGALAACKANLAARGFSDRTKSSGVALPLTIGQRLRACENPQLRPTPAMQSQAALTHFNSIWQSNRFPRDETGWPTAEELRSWNRGDRDGAQLAHGEIRWARDHRGYLRRGRVYGGINGMWWLVYGPGDRHIANLSAGELFSYRPDVARRVHPGGRKVLEGLLQAAVADQAFERAIVLRDLLSGPGAALRAA